MKRKGHTSMEQKNYIDDELSNKVAVAANKIIHAFFDDGTIQIGQDWDYQLGQTQTLWGVMELARQCGIELPAAYNALRLAYSEYCIKLPIIITESQINRVVRESVKRVLKGECFDKSIFC